MGNILFVVWRESLEAVLIVSILYSFIKKGIVQGKVEVRSLSYVWGGVAAGIALSSLLAVATVGVQDSLQGRALDYFQTTVLFVSALLMTQMVVWMNEHGKKIKTKLESDVTEASKHSGHWGVAIVAALAVAREGAELVVYLYSLVLENKGLGASGVAALTALGIALALFTVWSFSKGIKFISYPLFFRVTSMALLFSAAGLVVNGTNRLIEMDLLPSLVDPIWNTSAVLDGHGVFGGIVSAFTGYRARPSLMLVLIYTGYWLLTFIWMKREAITAALGFRSEIQLGQA